jgi:glycolate oxidase FAD binding subunit
VTTAGATAVESREEAAAALASLGAEGATVAIVGAGTKAEWGNATPPPDAELSTLALDRTLEHNPGDFTAVLEAGVPLAEAQRSFAAERQMLALDPPLGADDAATVGGVFATADAGPLRHRYGGARDLIVGITVALADGTLAKAGGKVIKNVAGYDLAKLFTGAFGTLGLIVDVSVRLHPIPEATASAVAESDDPDALGRTTHALSHSPLETDSLDVRWAGGTGAVLARFGGAAALEQARAAEKVLGKAGGDAASTSVVEDDIATWERQRTGQRSVEGAVVRVSGLQAQLPDVLRATERSGAELVGRAAHGLSWIALPASDAEDLVAAIARLREELAPAPCVVREAPAAVREAVDVWDERDPGRLELSRRLKERFDPGAICNRGRYVGGI